MPADENDGSGNVFRRAVEARYGFETWAGKTRAQDARAPRRFLIDHSKLEGYELGERVAVPETRAYIDFLRVPEADDVRIAVRVFEFDTVQGAHEALLDTLASAMAGPLPTCRERGVHVGDICYCGYDDPIGAIFFTRRNVFVRVENVGQRRTAVAEVALMVDRQITDTSG